MLSIYSSYCTAYAMYTTKTMTVPFTDMIHCANKEPCYRNKDVVVVSL